MLRLSLAGMAERWTLFVGAALSVCLGVALTQSSLLLLISAATLDPPPGLSAAARMTFDDGREASIAMLGVVMGSAAFLAVFIISSTFGFTVEQRRRDLALLRLVGGNRRQLRRLLTGEAVLLGSLGAALGIPAGLAVMAGHARLMAALGFLPAGFRGEWRMWIIGASLGTGIVLAIAGVLTAARRAARVRPLEALRDTGEAARVMTAGRWFWGLLFLGGALALILVAPHGGPAGGQAMSMNVPLCAAVAVAAFGPLLIPAVARLIPTGPLGPLGTLARANLRDGRRRSASVAAPVVVLIALVVGQAGATKSFTTAGIDEQRRATAADLVVSSVGPFTLVPGVASFSTEIEVPVRLTTGAGEEQDTTTTTALIVDPAAYARAHPGSASLLTLPAGTVAAGPGGEVSTGDRVRVELPGQHLGDLAVGASVPAAISGGADLLLPLGLVPADQLAAAKTTTFVRVKPGHTEVSTALAAHGDVSAVDDWLAADAAERGSTSNKILLVVLGVGALYALVGVVNSVVIGAAARRREFAEARVTGLSRSQVIRAALAESTAVTLAGVVLGLLAAGTAFAAVMSTTAAVTGTATLDLSWPVSLGAIALVLVITSVTSVFTSLSATRGRPVALLGARE